MSIDIPEGQNDQKNLHINFEWELETISVIQRRMATKMSMNRELGDCKKFHDALGKIEEAHIAIREEWYLKFGKYPKRHM